MDQIIVWREVNPQPNDARLNQTHAVTQFNTENKLRSIKIPTLKIHGDSDLVVPPRNAELLHERITGTKLVMIEHGQHWSFIQYYKQFNKVLNLLDKFSHLTHNKICLFSEVFGDINEKFC